MMHYFNSTISLLSAAIILACGSSTICPADGLKLNLRALKDIMNLKLNVSRSKKIKAAMMEAEKRLVKSPPALNAYYQKTPLRTNVLNQEDATAMATIFRMQVLLPFNTACTMSGMAKGYLLNRANGHGDYYFTLELIASLYLREVQATGADTWNLRQAYQDVKHALDTNNHEEVERLLAQESGGLLKIFINQNESIAEVKSRLIHNSDASILEFYENVWGLMIYGPGPLIQKGVLSSNEELLAKQAAMRGIADSDKASTASGDTSDTDTSDDKEDSPFSDTYAYTAKDIMRYTIYKKSQDAWVGLAAKLKL